MPMTAGQVIQSPNKQKYRAPPKQPIQTSQFNSCGSQYKLLNQNETSNVGHPQKDTFDKENK